MPDARNAFSTGKKTIYSLEGPCNGENTKSFGSMDWNRDEDINSGRWGGEGG